MKNLNILAKNALKEVTTNPLYSVSIRVDYDRPWTYIFLLAYSDVILFEQYMTITEKTQEEIQGAFLANIKYVLEEQEYKTWIDWLVELDSTVLPNYSNDESQIYWNGLEAVIYAPDKEAAAKAYEEWTGEKTEIIEHDGVFLAS